MASRSVKKTTVKTTTTSSGHSDLSGLSTPSGSGTQSPGRHRPPSPARLTRIQEKQELQNLNDRLANYIDRVRYLENENSRLLVQVKQTEEVVTREVSSIKNLYEGELADARKSLDDVAKEKARLQIEANKSRTQAEEALSKFHRKDHEHKDALKRITDLEAQVADLTARLADAESRKGPLEKQVASLRSHNRDLEYKLANGQKMYDEELLARVDLENRLQSLKDELAFKSQVYEKNLRSENRTLEAQLAKVRKQLEEESLMRVDLENRLQSIKEELAFKSQVHEQELNESRVRMTTTIEEVDGRMQNDYESRLGDALTEMRRDQELQVNIAKEEIISLYESKMGDLQTQAERSGHIIQTVKDELRVTKRRLDEVNSELGKLRGLNAQYENRITDLENQLKREQDEYFITLKYKDEEVKRLHMLLDDQTQEYSDLLDVKLKLDMEIAAYRKLLEGEEARLNLSQSFEATPRRAGTPSKVRGKKRKITSQSIKDVSQSSSSSGYGTTSMAKGSVEVHDVDVEGGKFIVIYNNSEKDVPIGGWQLKHIGEDQETTYKFHRNTVAKAGQTVTVWSADSDQTHDPPSHLVMKGQRWFIGDKMKTILLDTKGDEMAAREMNQSLLKSVSTYRSSISGPGDEVDSDEGVETDREKCSIM